MEKKHGIIVGVTILAIALAITIVSSVIKKKGEAEKQPPLSVSQDKGSKEDKKGDTVKDIVKEDKKEDSVSDKNKGQSNTNSNIPTSSKNDVTNPDLANKENNAIFEVAEETVSNPNSVENEVMLVSNKKVMLIDMEVDSPNNKQMVYVVELLTADSKKLSLYVNGVVYDDIKVGDTLNITYKKYINNQGIEIPLVVQAAKTVSK